MSLEQRIFKPIKVGNLELSNRLMFLAMAKHLSNEDYTTSEWDVAYYTNPVKHGVSLVATGACIVDGDYGFVMHRQHGLFEDKFIPSHRVLTDEVHAYGGKIVAQLWHPGKVTYPIPPEKNKACADWTKLEIKELQEKYAQTALRAKKAGFDGIEFHLAHNYLPEQFLVPLFNTRADEYGADTTENGLRFSLEAIERIKMLCGDDYPIIAKINGEDYTQGGMTIERCVEACKLLEKAGVVMLSISAGGGMTRLTGMSGDGRADEGCKVNLAEAVKKAVSIPVMATGNLRHPEYIEQILSEGKCDMIGMGRGLLADPEWLEKLQENRTNEIRYCVACMACFSEFPQGKSGCSVNPLALREYEGIYLKRDGDGRKVAIIGAGPAGLEAAVTLAKRDFKPVVFEKENTIGGTELLAAMPHGKNHLLWHIDYYQRQIERLGIEVRTGHNVTAEEIIAEEPYAIIHAAGSHAIFPAKIPGIEQSHVLQNRSVLKKFPDMSDSRIVVIGVGQVGQEVAETFARKGNTVTIIDMLERPPIKDVETMLSYTYAASSGVEIKLGYSLIAVELEAVVAESLADKTQIRIPADFIILCMGGKPNTDLLAKLEASCTRVYNVGDSSGMAKIKDAVEAGFNVAIGLE